MPDRGLPAVRHFCCPDFHRIGRAPRQICPAESGWSLRLTSACNRPSPIDIRNSSNGGIAQLVERQLCKLDVRGSNPLASSLCAQPQQNAFGRTRDYSSLRLFSPFSVELKNPGGGICSAGFPDAIVPPPLASLRGGKSGSLTTGFSAVDFLSASCESNFSFLRRSAVLRIPRKRRQDGLCFIINTPR